MKTNNYFTVISCSEASAVLGGSKASEGAEIIGYLVGKWVAIWQKNHKQAAAY